MSQNNMQKMFNLSTHEKASLLSGKDFWTTEEIADKVPSMTMMDGPAGLRKPSGSYESFGLTGSVPATCIPSECTLGCTFDEGITELVGRVLGEECRENGVDAILAPGLNIKRHPLGGRNFEYLSEDPHLSGKIGASIIRGIQSTGTSACMKHLAANSQETGRMTTDSVIDEGTLHDIYLRGFEIAVKEGRPDIAMTAYNKLNGEYCAQNSGLLEQLKEWGFDGLVVTDWGGLSESVPSVAAGLDLVMPGPRPDHTEAIEAAAANGTLDMRTIDSAASKVAHLAESHAKRRSEDGPKFDVAEHLAIARIASEAGSVLLKNDGVLPLSKGSKIAVIGELAKKPRYQGAGSSTVNPIELDCVWDALAELGFDVAYARGYDSHTGDTTKELIDEARAIAKSCDVAIVFAGLPAAYESEGFDRKSMAMPEGMNQLVEGVLGANPRTVTVLSGGGVMELPWEKDAPAILMTYLSGCQGGHATANLLAGIANPCGRLAESWPVSIEQTALGTGFPETDRRVLYIEGPYVGYRYYDAAKVEPLYHFGHGLSYTTFGYANMDVRLDENGARVDLDVQNTGDVSGAEIVQIYVSHKDATVPLPPKALAGFAKVHLAPCETKCISIDVDKEVFAYWDVQQGTRRIDSGDYVVCACASSADVRLEKNLRITENAPFAVSEEPRSDASDKAKLSAYFDVSSHGFTPESFAELYGKPFPNVPPIFPFTINTRFEELKTTAAGRVFYEISNKLAMKAYEGDPGAQAMIEASAELAPLRFMIMAGMPAHVLDAVIDAMNEDSDSGIETIRRMFGGE